MARYYNKGNGKGGFMSVLIASVLGGILVLGLTFGALAIADHYEDKGNETSEVEQDTTKDEVENETPSEEVETETPSEEVEGNE